MLLNEVLVIEFVAVDGFPASTLSHVSISSLTTGMFEEKVGALVRWNGQNSHCQQ